jgi:hypothetical protein
MTVGRLSGDRIVQHFGTANIIIFGGLCAATGFVLATLVPSWPVTLLGFALVGVGCSNVVPVLFTSTGRQTAMPESMAVPAISGMGYAGIRSSVATSSGMSEIDASRGKVTHMSDADTIMTRRHPSRAARAPANGIARIEPMPRHSRRSPRTPSSMPTRALANGTSGAHAAIPKPAMKNTIRVAICSRRAGADE